MYTYDTVQNTLLCIKTILEGATVQLRAIDYSDTPSANRAC